MVNERIDHNVKVDLDKLSKLWTNFPLKKLQQIVIFGAQQCSGTLKALVKRYMIVDGSWARPSCWPPIIIHCRRLSSTPIRFERVQILHDI